MCNDRPLSVGVDIVQVSRVQRLLEEIGHPAMAMILTPEELDSCTARGDLDRQAVSGRIALKEATFKTFRCTNRPLPWKHIVTTGGGTGPPDVRLSGAARQLAEDRGINQIRVSLSHDGDYAIAVAVALSDKNKGVAHVHD